MFWLLAQKAQESGQPPMANGWLIFWLMIAVLVLPYIIGAFVAKRLRMKDHGGRIGTVLLAVAATAVPFFYRVGVVIEDSKTEFASAESALADAQLKLAEDSDDETLKSAVEAQQARKELAAEQVENAWSPWAGFFPFGTSNI